MSWEGPWVTSFTVFRRLDSEVDFVDVGQIPDQSLVDDLPTGTQSNVGTIRTSCRQANRSRSATRFFTKKVTVTAGLRRLESTVVYPDI